MILCEKLLRFLPKKMKVTIEFCELVFAKFLCMRLNFCGYPFVRKFNLYIHNNRHKWVSKGRKSPFGTRFCGTQSLVCYTFVPLAVYWMSVALHDICLFSGAEQAVKFREEQKKFVFLTARKRNKRYIKSPSQRKKKAALIKQNLRVCSRNKTLKKM